MNEVLDILLHPLLLPVVVALAAGAVAYVFSRLSPLLCKVLGLLASAAVLYSGIVVLALPALKELKLPAVSFATGLSFQFELAVTPLGMVVVVAAAAFAVLISLYSFRAMAGEYWEGKFYAYLIWALGGTCIVGLAGNLLVLLIGWELVTLMLFLMINMGRGNAKAGAAKTYGVLGFADACLLLAIVMLIAAGGTDRLSLSRGAVSVASMGATGYIVYVLILIAALAKAGAIPLHSWIPACAEKAPTPVMAYLPAAVDKLLGIYLLAVLTLQMFQPDGTMQVVMMIIGGVTIIAAVLMAMVQHNLKKLLAFHAVSQVGYMVLGIATGTTIGIIGGLFHMVNNAIYKSNLFLMSGAVGRAAGSDEIENMGGLAKLLPVTFVCGLISALAISGIPPFNGFVSKWLVYQGTLEVANRGLATALLVAAVFGSALTLASFVKVMYSAFLSPAPKNSPIRSGKVHESLAMVVPMVLLAAACVVLGLFPQLVTEDVLKPAMTHIASTGQEVSATPEAISTGTLGLWSPTTSTGLIIIGIVIGGVFLLVSAWGRKVRVVRPFLAGEVPTADDDRFRFPGTGFYETISRLPLIGPLLHHGGAGAMDLYHWTARYGRTFIELLRAQHTGLISLYVAWCVIGVTIILIYLLIWTRT